MRLCHNLFSLNIFRNYKNTITSNSKSIGNISSGEKLKSAKDNPNKIAQSENLRMEIISRSAAQSNIQDSNSMIQTFDGALQEYNNNLKRLKTLVVQASNGTNSEDDRKVIQKEIDGIKQTLDDLANNTNFNGMKLTSKNAAAEGATEPSTPMNIKTTTIGAIAGETVDIPFYDVTTKGLGINNINVVDPDKLDDAIDKVDVATKKISMIRSKYGSLQSRLEETYSSMGEIDETLSSSQSNIADADIAEEMMNIARTRILYQSSIALMTQSNKLPQDALNILANVK